VLAVLAMWLPAPAAAAGEGCPKAHGGPAALNWGMNASEQLAAGFASGLENSAQPVNGLSGATQVRAGFKFGLALMGDCTLRSWGKGNKGQLGNSLQQTETHPVAVTGLTDVKEIAVANAHAMALRYDGTVWTWGASEFGERGNKEKGFERTARQTESGWFVARDRPTEVPNLEDVKQIAAGGTRDYALLANGEVMAWGDDEKGLLGVEESSKEECNGENHIITAVQCSTVPREVKVGGLGALTGVERIGAGEESAYAVRNGGHEVVAWGAGGKAQLGNGEANDHASPVKVAFEPPAPVTEIAGGSQHVLALLANGEVYAWGADGLGQLGFETGPEASESCGRQKCSMVPEAVGELSHVVAVAAAGEGLSFALKEEENATKVVYAFGSGGFFELLGLGNQPFTSTSTPTPIEGISSVRGISASGTTAVALLQSGTAVPPRLSLNSSEEALTFTWKVPAEPYKVRYRPVGTREFSKLQEGSCKGECTLQFTGLKPQPYEVILKNPEGREGREKTRRIVGTPTAPASWPANTSLPTIAGSPAIETAKLRLGQTLTVSPGSWSNKPTQFKYQWLRCEGNGEAGSSEELGSECEPITTGKGPATGETYEVQSRDVARTIAVRVEAKNGAGSSAAVSQPELILALEEESEPDYPTPIQAPTLSGSAVQGQTLTAHHGSWENSPTEFEDKWFRCKAPSKDGTGASCGAITVNKEPVTGETYVPTTEDVGKWIEVQERADNPGGYEISVSQAVQIAPPAAPTNSTPPSISGTVEQGQVLTAVEGTWTNAANSRSWQWLRCDSSGHNCNPISGAEHQTYTLTSADVTHTVVVSETAYNDVGSSASANSAATGVVPTPPPSPPEAQSSPTITGTPEQGATLTSHPATWSGEVKRYSYQWKRCDNNGVSCNPIGGANETTYVLRGLDVGHRIEFKETASNATGSQVVNSAPTAQVVGVLPASLTAPTIKGKPQPGVTLRAFRGSWSGEPTSYEYRWTRCDGAGENCHPISGATSKSYAPTGSDVGYRLQVEEIARNATGAGSPASSAATAQVVPEAPEPISAPTITGTPQQGEPLTAQAGTWSNSPTGHSLQWLRCEPGECVPIPGATGPEYTVTPADVNLAIAVRETARNAGGFGAAVSEQDPVGGTPVPFISALEPPTGPTGGGTEVTIRGGNFAGTTGVAFGFTEAAHFEIVSPSTIRATAPPGSETVDVTVTSPQGTSAVNSHSRFTYGVAPQVTHIEPKEGSQGGGTTVTITGSDLGEATAVHFGASTAQSFGVQSSTSITAVSPAGSGTVGVTVTTPYGTTTAGPHEQFTYIHTGVVPVVKKLSAKKGPAAGGTLVTITGSIFAGATEVMFGQTPATKFEVESEHSITAYSPPGTSVTVDVTVVNQFGSSTPVSGDHFKYEKPTISSITPSSGPKAGGTSVTITGSGYAPGEGITGFSFAKALATNVDCVSTSECTLLTPSSASAKTVKVTAVVGASKSSAKEAAAMYAYH
jgi:alpha-tubulin suppressor-like RCC1 family protein